MERYQTLSPHQLHPNPDNPRYDAGDVTELSASIRSLGQLQLLVVRLAPELSQAEGENHYYIEAGYRRWVAMKALDLPIACRIRIAESDESPRRRNLLVGIAENVHRKDLNPIEKAKAFGRLRDEEGMTQEEIAKASGIHSTAVNRYLALLDLAPKTQEAVRTGALGTTDALRLVRQHREEQRRRHSQGGKRKSAEWEPDYLTFAHPQAKKAAAMCTAREHSLRRRVGNVACGQCWETAIRQDQDLVIKANYEAAAPGVVPFRSSWPVDHPMSR